MIRIMSYKKILFFQFMKDIYKIRSDIVHGGETIKKPQSYDEKYRYLEEKSKKAEYYIRAAINKYIKLVLAKKMSPDYFDSLVLRK